MPLYTNLLFNIFQKIAEKYHPHLRLTTPQWKAISKRIILYSLFENIPYNFKKNVVKMFINSKILQIGKFIKSEYYDKSSLIYSCQVGDKILFYIMIKNNNDISDWKLSLKYAYLGQHSEIIKLIIATGINHIQSEEELIHFWNGGLYGACQIGDIAIAKFTIEKGANDWEGALDSSCRGKHLEMINFMINLIHEKQITEIDWSIALASTFENIQYLNEMELKKIDDISEILNKQGFCEASICLQGACYGGSLELVKLVFENTNFLKCHFDNGMACACFSGHFHIIQYMIEKGANNWNFGLKYACKGKNFEIAKFMIKCGAMNIEECIQDNLTPNFIKKYLISYSSH